MADGRGDSGSDRRQLPEPLTVPHPQRCDPQRADYVEILQRHAAAIAAGRDTYIDPTTGYQVFTARFLWERGFCCDSGCRHCPYLAR
jgi:uncharacterized protein DUF5522